MSLTITSLLVSVIATVLKGAGISIVEADIQTTVLTIAQIIGAIGVYYGRYRAGDINIFGKKF